MTDPALPKVALVLGGGGIKPVSVIPLINFLETCQIQVSLIAACSGGSIIASLWASGYTTDQILNELLPGIKKSTFKPNWKALLSFFNLPFSHLDKESALVQSKPIQNTFKKFWGTQRLENLPIKTIIQVTDFQ